ncbi:MAG: DegQ family serine endoprotease [Thermodesulfobacteriota bacterium]|nr:DegQ family serine endoprotease [Thermodesulfobacteriota bacterium]
MRLNKNSKKGHSLLSVNFFLMVFLFVVFYTPQSRARILPEDFVRIAEAENPKIVNISSTKLYKRRQFFPTPGPFGFGDEFFERFFGHMPEEKLKRSSLGSGFIYSKDGYIITNAHVVAKADEISIKLYNGEEYDAEIVGIDKKTDIALIKIESEKDLPVAKLGDSDKLKVGEWVMAIGNPFGFSHTVTVGVVSAKGRVIGSGPYDDFIQTDASINPGNSGGPLIDNKGDVIGINTAIIASGQGIGFAIPINMAKSIINQLKEGGKVTRGWLGIMVQELTPELAKALGSNLKSGALVAQVMEDTPAEKAGIKRGDILIDFDGKEIKSSSDLPKLVAATPVEKLARITIIRKGEEKKFYVKVGKMPEDEIKVSGKQSEKNVLGIKVSSINPNIASIFGIEDKSGVIITGIEPYSPADKAGLREGDIILEINRNAIEGVGDVEDILDRLQEGDIILFLLKRKDQTYYKSIKIHK